MNNILATIVGVICFIPRGLKYRSYCNSRKKANRCFYFTRGCGVCLKQANENPDR